jgi:hypothetical protein
VKGYEPFESILLKGKGVPYTDGDGVMDYNDNPYLDDQDIFTRWSEATFREAFGVSLVFL